MEQDLFDDPVNLYLAEVAKVPALSRAEERGCIREVRAGGSEAEIAGKRLVEANLSLVVSVAKRYKGGNLHILDLIQAGNQGLLTALRTLGARGQVNFTDLAANNVERAIRKAIAAKGT